MGNYGANPNPDLNQARTLAFQYALAPQAQLKIDQFSTATSSKVFSMNRKIGKTRLLFLIDPAITPG